MDEVDEIIVYRQFDTAIEANIIKTKLDAFGVPCFLTEENLVNLYPGQPIFPFRVRLHIFAKDFDRAEQILAEESLSIEDDSVTRCPKCQSKSIEREFPKKLSATFLGELNVLFLGIFFPEKKINHCRNCNFEFD